MIPSDYRFRLINLHSWQEDGFLPVRNCTISWKRGDIGRGDASLPLIQGAVPIRPGEQLLLVEDIREINPPWAGLIWAVDFDTGAAYATLRATEYPHCLLRRRRIRVDLNYTNIDQFDILRDLLMLAGGGRAWPPGSLTAGSWPADLHLDPGSGPSRPLSGTLRTREYLGIDRKEIWEAASQLSAVAGGFDYFIRPYWAGDELRFELLFDFPPGALHEDVVLEYRQGWAGSSIVDYRWPWDGSSMVNRAMAANDEEVREAQDASAWNYFPLLEDVVQKGGEGGVTSSDTLLAHAQALLAESRRPSTAASLTLRQDVHLPPSMLGKLVRVRLTSWRHPPGPDGEPGFDDDLRINEIQLSLPSDERGAEISLGVDSLLWDPLRAAGGGSASTPIWISPIENFEALLRMLGLQQAELQAALRRRS